MKTKFKLVLIFFFISIFFISKNVFSQTIEEIYIQLPEKYIYSPLSQLAFIKEDDQFITDRKMLKKLLSMDMSEINQIGSTSYRLETKIIDNKNGYIQFCDRYCAWEFTMKVFNNEKRKPTYIAIFEGNNDGATSGTNKILHFLEFTKSKEGFIFKDVREKFKPTISYQQVIGPGLYQKYKSSIDTYFQKEDEDLFDTYELNRYTSNLIGYVNGTYMLFYDIPNPPQEIKIITDSISDKPIEFKWDGKKFKRLNFNYLIQ